VIFHVAQLLISSTWRDIIPVSSKCAAGLLFLGFAESAAYKDLLWSQLEEIAVMRNQSYIERKGEMGAKEQEERKRI